MSKKVEYPFPLVKECLEQAENVFKLSESGEYGVIMEDKIFNEPGKLVSKEIVENIFNKHNNVYVIEESTSFSNFQPQL